MHDPDPQSQLDLLRRIETVTADIDNLVRKRSEHVFRRYPLTFALLALFGAVAVGEGVKGIIELSGLGPHPVYMLLIGLVILVVTGTVYKKLDK